MKEYLLDNVAVYSYYVKTSNYNSDLVNHLIDRLCYLTDSPVVFRSILEATIGFALYGKLHRYFPEFLEIMSFSLFE